MNNKETEQVIPGTIKGEEVDKEGVSRIIHISPHFLKWLSTSEGNISRAFEHGMHPNCQLSLQILSI